MVPHPALAPRLTFALALALAATACEPTRAPVELVCSSTAHCPATGDVYCDLVTKRCVPCDGACPGSDYDAGPTADAASAADAANADTTTASCVGRCGNYDEAASCQCDDLCVDTGDCCSDYATICSADTTADATSSDTTQSASDSAQQDGAQTDSASSTDAQDATMTPDVGLASDATASDTP